MRRRNFRLEALNLVKALSVCDAVWVTARVGPFPQLALPARYWLELRHDVVILYPASTLLLRYNSTATVHLSLTHFESLPQLSISDIAHAIPSTHVTIFVLPTTKITSKSNDSYLILKARHYWTSARLQFDNPLHLEQWQQTFISALTRQRKHLSDFCVLKHIGKGASGRVYQVKDKTSDERLALKVIEKTTVFESEDTYRHAMDERIVLQMIRQHPFILDMRYAFQNAKRLFLVTEYCSGGDLFEYMNRKVAPLDEPTARFVAAEVLLALEHLHALDIVYRDLKLENILIDDSGHTRLADFGLTKVLRKSDGALTRTSTFCGTREYVAPEMLRGDAYDTTIDFWTFGILLYEMLSGRTPFYTSDHDEIYKRIEKAPVFYPRNLSGEVRSLLVKLLKREPSERLGAGKGGVEAIKQHEWFDSVDWQALMHKETFESPLEKSIRFMNREEGKQVISPNSKNRKSRRQLKQEKALLTLEGDVKEDLEYVSALPLLNSPTRDFSTRLKSPMEKRGEGILAGYSFCDPSPRTAGTCSEVYHFAGGVSSFVTDTTGCVFERGRNELGKFEAGEFVENRSVNKRMVPKSKSESPTSIRAMAEGG